MQGYSAKGITIIKGNIQPEHVHLLISIPPSLSIAQVMQYLKGRSSKKIARRIFVVEEAILGSTYVGDWVFCTSVGKVTQDTIIEYIESQKDDIDDIFVKDGML